MIGAIIGDIVGSRFEGDDFKSKDFNLFARECRPTDDTVMTLAVGDALLAYREEGGNLREHAVKKMRKWGRMYINAGYGSTFLSWLMSKDPRPYGSWGNGAAMRVSLCGWAAKTYAEAIDFARAVTEVTHNHPEATKAAETVAALVFFARNGVGKESLKQYVDENYCPIDFRLGEIRDSYGFEVACRDAVPQAIASFLESNGFVDAIRNTVSLGGDTDTIAAIAGAIAESYYGVDEEVRAKGLGYLDGFQTDKLWECEEKLFQRHVTIGGDAFSCHGDWTAWCDSEVLIEMGMIPSLDELTQG